MTSNDSAIIPAFGGNGIVLVPHPGTRSKLLVV